MTRPVRIQRQRTRGWRMPANTVYVGRPTKWGNPFRVEREGGFQWIAGPNDRLYSYGCSTDREGRYLELIQEAVDLFESAINPAGLAPEFGGVTYPSIDDIRRELRGKNLACWCPPGQPCHADALLAIANGEEQ